MDLPFSAAKAIDARRSVRTFLDAPLPEETQQKLLQFVAGLPSPFSSAEGPRIAFINKSTSAEGERLGTYGTIKNANVFAAFAMPDAPESLLQTGFLGEAMTLYAVSMGFGAVWLGGTFNKGAFANAMGLKEGEILPAVMPIGFPAEKRLVEKMFRKIAKSDTRKPWSELFFHNDFRTALTERKADEYAEALELLRLAPSAVNAQPWRVLKMDNTLHFYVYAKPGISHGDMRIKYIDMGIALCHFAFSLDEQGISGPFFKKEPDVKKPEGYQYIMSFKAD